jgi:hypothetical protein
VKNPSPTNVKSLPGDTTGIMGGQIYCHGRNLFGKGVGDAFADSPAGAGNNRNFV